MTSFHLIQTSLIWESAQDNRQHLQKMLQQVQAGHVAILPEMFSTGFSMASSRLAETMEGPTVAWMRQQSADRQITICGSLMIKSNDEFFNRFLWVETDGTIRHYDKRHLFRMADEQRFYSPGAARQLIEVGGIRLSPQVCYDLRFPVWSRNTDAFNVLVYVANWPASRRAHWLALLRARAIENLCFVIGVNRIGSDGNGVTYAGDSIVFDFQGNTLLDLGDLDQGAVFTPDLSALAEYRKIFPAHLDADTFVVR